MFLHQLPAVKPQPNTLFAIAIFLGFFYFFFTRPGPAESTSEGQSVLT